MFLGLLRRHEGTSEGVADGKCDPEGCPDGMELGEDNGGGVLFSVVSKVFIAG